MKSRFFDEINYSSAINKSFYFFIVDRIKKRAYKDYKTYIILRQLSVSIRNSTESIYREVNK